MTDRQRPELDSIARVRVSDGTTTYARRRLVFPGATLVDSSVNEQVTVTPVAGNPLPLDYVGPANQDALILTDNANHFNEVILNTTYGVKLNFENGTVVYLTTDGSGALYVAQDNGSGAPDLNTAVALLPSASIELRNNASAAIVRFDGATGKFDLGPEFTASANQVVFQGVGNLAPDLSAPVQPPAWGAWIDESLSRLVFKVVYANGTTVKSGFIALT